MTDLASQIATIARKSALIAAKNYSRMSIHGHLWNQGIEPYISAEIGEQIFKKTKNPIELEYPYAKVLATIGEKDVKKKFLKSRHHELTERSKFDVAVFRKNNKKPIGLIEVKKRFSNFKIETDRNRVLDAVLFCNEENRGIRFGIIIAVEAIRTNQQKNPETKIREALDVLNADQENYRAKIEFDQMNHFLGFTTKGNEIIGARAYSITIRS